MYVNNSCKFLEKLSEKWDVGKGKQKVFHFSDRNCVGKVRCRKNEIHPVNCIGKLCKNPIHFVCIFIVRRFFGQKSWKLTLGFGVCPPLRKMSGKIRGSKGVQERFLEELFGKSMKILSSVYLKTFKKKKINRNFW